MSITIYTFTHKPFIAPPDSMYVPIQVGAALHDDLGFLRDDNGDEISKKNPYYSELTGLYWVWKNDMTSDYIGTAHYRRYLLNENGTLFTQEEILALLGETHSNFSEATHSIDSNPDSNPDSNIETNVESNTQANTEVYDLVTTKLLTLEYSYYDAFNGRHHNKDLDLLLDVIKELQPDYASTYKALVHQPHSYFGNMFVMKRELYHKYMEFLFPLLFELEKRVDLSDYDGYQKRLFGFLSEFLLYVYVVKNNLKVKEAHVGIVGDKAETNEVKSVCAKLLKAKDIKGAKTYFSQKIAKKPDLLMEASDLNQECRLLMQAITTLEWQEKEEGISRLEMTTDFHELIAFYRELNQLGRNYPKDCQRMQRMLENGKVQDAGSSMDAIVLQFVDRFQVTAIELKIALMLCK